MTFYKIHKMLKKGNFAPRIGSGASVFLAAVVEYLASEMLDLASEVAFQNQKSRLVPRHLLTPLLFAIKNDEELSRMLTGVTISQGGVLPAINAQLLLKKTMKKQAESSQKSWADRRGVRLAVRNSGG
ncbi:histone H2A, sperm-like [Pararge aegeria]|uniref:histone H2A, sperm-like n=1 Tax=Pararge aegeria TaxID=116150 RepID=UPI0019D17E22|nr:histone H2A, sperm-like [Pararge aegeria]